MKVKRVHMSLHFITLCERSLRYTDLFVTSKPSKVTCKQCLAAMKKKGR
jgi:hypothetical protein